MLRHTVGAADAVRRHWRLRTTLRSTAIGLVSTVTLVTGTLTSASAVSAQPAGPAAAHAAAVTSGQDWVPACALATAPGQATCLVLKRTNVAHHPQVFFGPGRPPTGEGYGPSDLRDAYDLPSTAGRGLTVAVVDAFDDPDAQADLNTYRSAWGLPPCNAGCFRKVNEQGQASPLPPPDGKSGWDVEESLDLDMVSAICPYCHILVVETSTQYIPDLGTGVNAAVRLGAIAVSNSYGMPDRSIDLTYDRQYYDHPGVAVTAASGDYGYQVNYPAASPYVTAVGGTTLIRRASSSRGWIETAWHGTGSGCSAYEAKPSWQKDAGCHKRTNNDVAAIADPNTGVAVYDSYRFDGSGFGGWGETGGTSVSSPIIASVFALAGKPAPGTYPSSYIYSHTSALYDITYGWNAECTPAYLCTAGPGYDGPTGWGTPHGTAAFAAPHKVTVASPGNVTSKIRVNVRLQIKATDSASGQTLTYSAAGLPAGLAISPTTGLITGRPAKAGHFTVTVTARDISGASGSATFAWTVST